MRPNSIENARCLARKIVLECARKCSLSAEDLHGHNLTEEFQDKMRVVIQDRKFWENELVALKMQDEE